MGHRAEGCGRDAADAELIETQKAGPEGRPFVDPGNPVRMRG